MLEFFLDPILKAPTLGSMLICLSCALMGVLIFIKHETLIGETLSHATYPGILIGSLISIFMCKNKHLTLLIIIGAALSAYLALYLLKLCKTKLKMSSDAALCFTLTGFFGVGVTLASYLQNTHSQFYKQATVYLLGQVATISDKHLPQYLLLALTSITILFVFYKSIQISSFDKTFASSIGIKTTLLDTLLTSLMVLTVVISIKGVGLFLLSGMLVAPAIAARQWTNTLYKMFIVAGIFGVLSGYFGMYFSLMLPKLLSSFFTHSQSLPSGPMIVLASSVITLFSLMLSPKTGWLTRLYRILKFKFICQKENLLKSLWHLQQKKAAIASFDELTCYQKMPYIAFYLLTRLLKLYGYININHNKFSLTQKGFKKAQGIVRMHRLWEVYLVHLGVGIEKVHHNAEEMEHIITPSIEEKLLNMMKHPKLDPHNQPIPSKV